MACFKDINGKSWEVRITPTSMRRVKQLLGLNISTCLQDEFKTLQEIFSDPITVVDLLYALCKPEADASRISDEQFGEAMVGDVLPAAANAFLEALADFFPTRQGNLLRRMFRRMAEHQEALATEMEKNLESLLTSTEHV